MGILAAFTYRDVSWSVQIDKEEAYQPSKYSPRGESSNTMASMDVDAMPGCYLPCSWGTVTSWEERERRVGIASLVRGVS